MTAVLALMATSSAPIIPKRQGFSIESLIGMPEPPLPPPAIGTTPPRPVPVRPLLNREVIKEERQREREERHREKERELHKEKEMQQLRERQFREREREAELARERELVLDSIRDREKEFREIRDRELARERELKDNREDRSSNPHLHRLSPRSSSPASPRTEKSLTPQSENRVSVWPGDEFKHILGSFHPGPLDSAGLYQPLRVCNRTLASMGGLAGPPNALGVGMSPHFSPLSINPLLYSLPRELPQQPHPLLAARYPGFIHPRYQMGPPPGLLFHPYRKPKRNRTAFSPSQLLQLEQAFEKNHYVVGQERKALAGKLQLTETQVKVWFQNRRTKHKRMKAEEDGGTSGSQVEGNEGDAGKNEDGNSLCVYVEGDDDECSDEDEEDEELSVTEDN